MRPTDTGVVPTADQERILALDVLRGFALFGVFVVNASISSRPFREAVELPVDAPPSETLAWILLNGAFVTKFVALFSILFGVGLVLQCQRIVARGRSPRLYLRRLAWLAVFGLLHGCLLYEGDILFPYALAGSLLFWLRDRSPNSLLRLALAVYLVGLTLEALGALQPFPEDPELDALVARAHQEGSLAFVVRVRAFVYAGWLWVSSGTHFNWQVVALFLLGAALMKRGWLQGGRKRFRKTAIAGLASGTALEVACYALHESGGAGARVASAILFAIGSLCLAAGYAGAVVWAVDAGLLPRVQRALAAVGRMALTNYVLQSLFMNVLFQSFGLGLWSKLTRWQVFGIVCALFAAQVAFSSLWLRAFAMGPLEWLWRRLTYGKEVAMRSASAPEERA